LRKKAFLIIVAFSFILSLTGCWNYREISESSIVAGMAIDIGEKGYNYHLTLEIINVEGGESSKIKSVIIETDADTIFVGVRNFIAITSKKLFFGHCKVIILSEQIARNGLKEELDFIMRDAEPRIDIDVLLSKEDTAGEILKTKGSVNPIISYEIDTMLKNSSQSLVKSTTTKAYELVNILETPGISLTLPCIMIRKEEDKGFVFLSGTAIFKRDKLCGFLDSYQTKTFNFIVNTVKGGALVVRMNDEKTANLATEIFTSKTKIKPIIKGDSVSFRIDVKTEVAIADVVTDFEASNSEGRQELKYIIENSIETEIKDLVAKVQKECGVDIFGFGRKLYENNPKLFNKYNGKWNENFKDIGVEVHADVSIRGGGNVDALIFNVD